MSSSHTNPKSSGQFNNNSQDVPQFYQPEEGAYNEQQEQQNKHNQVGTDRSNDSSQDVTQAPEEA